VPLHQVVLAGIPDSCVFHLRKNHKTLIGGFGSFLLIYFAGVASVRHQFSLRVQRIGQVLAYLSRLLCGDQDPSNVLVPQVGQKVSIPHWAPSVCSTHQSLSSRACDCYPLDFGKNPLL
jgi:hypothetical protein